MNDKRLLVIAYGTNAAILLCGTAFVVLGGATKGMSYYIYRNIDLPTFTVTLVTIALLIALTLRLGNTRAVSLGSLPIDRLPIWPLAAVVLGLTVLGTHLIHWDHAFSMDEWLTRMQGRIFLTGKLAGQLPEEWQAFGRGLHHWFVNYDPVSGRLASDYRPGMAILYALFETVGLGDYVSAVMTAGSVVLVASIARQLWPDQAEAAVVAALLIATSSQALAMGLTSYSMPAHMFFNLLWLRLFLVDRIVHHILAACVGVATASLHQVHMHVFFAAPFLATLLRPFRPELIFLYSAIYLIGHLAVLSWSDLWVAKADVATGPGGLPLINRLVTIARLPNWYDVTTVLANLARFVAWQSLALIPLLALLGRRATWSKPTVLLAASVATSLAPYFILMPDQGHGWGYRYLHGLIGPIALLGAAGWIAARDRGAICRAIILTALLASPFVLVPARALYMERLVAAYAQASRYVHGQSADVVVVDTGKIVFGDDLIRNGPFTPEPPAGIDLRRVTVEQIEALCARYSVAFVALEDVAPFGIVPADYNLPPELDYFKTTASADYAEKVQILTSPACRAAPPS